MNLTALQQKSGQLNRRSPIKMNPEAPRHGYVNGKEDKEPIYFALCIMTLADTTPHCTSEQYIFVYFRFC